MQYLGAVFENRNFSARPNLLLLVSIRETSCNGKGLHVSDQRVREINAGKFTIQEHIIHYARLVSTLLHMHERRKNQNLCRSSLVSLLCTSLSTSTSWLQGWNIRGGGGGGGMTASYIARENIPHLPSTKSC